MSAMATKRGAEVQQYVEEDPYFELLTASPNVTFR